MDKLARIDEAIRRYYKTTSNGVSEELIDAILYSVDSGGKRIRPLILLEMIEDLGYRYRMLILIWLQLLK